MNAPLLQRLKLETAVQHADLEDRLQLLRPDMHLAEYQLLLERFFGFYAPWEQRAGAVVEQIIPDFHEARRKTPLLHKDLYFLGSDIASIPNLRELPATDSVPAVLGSLYVLEGATLGGQILALHFSRKFGLSRAHGCSFFSSYGPEVGQRWKSFCDLLVVHSSSADEASIVQSAKQTFSCLGEWLQQEGSVAAC